jgi:transaldolase/glucose-6-phosphate isomerase
LAFDAEATVAEARRLWRMVDRPNLMIKVPGTPAGPDAVRRLIGEGINVNVTLLFAIEAYLAVADAHAQGLETFQAGGGDVRRVHGVASFFVSRIDGKIDRTIDQRLKSGASAAHPLNELRGKVAIANAKTAYQQYLGLMDQPRWTALKAAGAQPQRLLWASTGVKDPTYPDTLYVDALIGPDTVATLPPDTLKAFRNHGRVSPSLTDDPQEAAGILAAAERLGLDLKGVAATLVDEGVKQFVDSFDALLGAIESKRADMLGSR